MSRKSLVFFLIAVFSVPALYATRVARLDLTEIRDKSVTVFRGSVVDIETRLDEGTLVWTDYSVVVDEVLFGQLRKNIMKVSFAGGTHAGKTVIVHGMPHLVAGQSYVFFLEDAGNGAPMVSPTTGWGQGIFQLVKSPHGGEALVSYDKEPIELTSGGMLKRGPRVDVVDGKIADRPYEAYRSNPSLEAPEPIALNVDGSVAPRGPKPLVLKEQSVSQRKFATMTDLRAFVGRRIEEAPRPDDRVPTPRTQHENR